MPKQPSKCGPLLVIGVILLISAILAFIGALTARAGTVSDPFEGMSGVSGVQSGGGRNGMGSIGGLVNSGGCGLPGDESGVVDIGAGVISAFFSGDLATEITQVTNSLHLVAQQCHQARMRLLSDINTIPSATADLLNTQQAANRTGVVWGADASNGEYDRLYPASLVGRDAAGIVEQESQQQEAGREASRASKILTGQLVEQIRQISDRMGEISEALDACKAGGQTCTGDLNTQATVLAAQVQAKTVLLESVKARAGESVTDYNTAAKQRSEAWDALMRGAGPGM